MNTPKEQPDIAKQPPAGQLVSGFWFVAKLFVTVGDVVAVFFGAIAIFAFAARFSWAADLCCQFRVQLLMILAVANFVYWIWRRGKIAHWVLICFIANLLPLSPYLIPNLSADANVTATARVTRIMTFNLLQGNQHHDEVVDYVTENAPDVFVALESDQEWTDGLRPLHSIYPHRHIIDGRGTSSIAVYSLLPLESVDVHLSTRRRLPSLDLGVTVDGSPIRIFATHPCIPLTPEKARMRNEQLDEIESMLDHAGPRILLGDFNCVPWSPHFADLLTKTDLQPAGYGRGLRPTWYRRARAYGPLRQTWIFALKLDHVLLSPDLTVIDHRIGPCLGSDHRPVTVDFVVGSTSNAQQPKSHSQNASQ
jgi:endonuclease/exonuclease/phosphatase (EEP) superfamily protein YafD